MNRSLLFSSAFLCLLFSSTQSLFSQETGFHSIFDGKTLTGWQGEEGWWKVVDGTIVGESTEEHPLTHNTFLVWELGEVDDFELKLQFRISGTDRANSGIQFRGIKRDDGHVIGYQADIDRAGQWIGSLYDEATGRGPLATRGHSSEITASGEIKTKQVNDPAQLFEHINLDGWNEYSINARGNHITLKLNGNVTAEVVDNDPQGLDRSGLLALQLHSGPPMKIEFKDIQLKRFPLQDGFKKVVFVAGTPSHGYASHEHNAGCKLLAKKLAESGVKVVSSVYTNGWPKDPSAFDNADTVVSYCDGGSKHYLNDNLDQFQHLVDERGVGLVCIHYAVETVTGAPGESFLKWMGGFFEADWSVNPHWTAKFEEFPKHPTTNGVQPFEINDEWYYHMRFQPDMKGVTPILTDLPPRESLNRPDGHHSGNPYVRAAVMERKEPQHVAWAYDRPNDKGRGFGFTGGHFHNNWQDDNFRKLVLNAILWTAHAEVPAEGVNSPTPTEEELEANQDYPKPDPNAPPRQRRQQPRKQTSTENENVEASHASVDAVEQLKVHPDLQATLFASEPMMTNPASIDIDHLGRVWVCEAINYRAFRNADVIGDRKEGDRILVLEDTNGDAKADKSTVFYQGHDVDSAHGILILPTPSGKGLRAIVSALDSVFFLIDDDGDLKSDRKEVLFTGIDGSQHDHGIHAFHFGPDGKLYFNFGNAGKQIKNKRGETIIDKAGNVVDDSRNPYQDGMVFRCNLDGSDFETLGWNFRNNWEVCVDSFGTMWQSDNDDDGNRGVRINYVMPYGNYGYKDELTGAGWKDYRTGWNEEIPLRHWHLNDPGVVPNMLQTGAGAPTGICLYEGDMLPEIFRGQPIHCDAGPFICRAYITQRDGAGYKAEIVDILDGSVSKWFRPSDVCIAPDGSIMVADWYDPGVGGHRMQDVEHGRIFRVTPKGAQFAEKYTVSKLDLSTPKGAVAALSSPNMSRRYLGWTTLMEMGEKALPALKEMWKSDQPYLRARALWAFGNLKISSDQKLDVIVDAMNDSSNVDLQITANRLARQLLDEIPAERYQGRVHIDDMSDAFAREMLITIRDVELDHEPELWGRLALRYDGKDRWYLEALGIAAEGQWDECLASYLDQGGSFDSQPGREIVWRSRSSRTPELLTKLIRDPQTSLEELPRLFRALDFQKRSSKEDLILEMAFGDLKKLNDQQTAYVRAEALNRLGGFDINSKPEYAKAFEESLDANKGTTQFIKLVDKFGVKNRFPDVLKMAQENPDSQIAVEALEALYNNKQYNLVSEPLFGDDRELAEKTLAAMTTAADGRSSGPLMAVIEDANRPLWARRGAVKALGASLPGAQKLLTMAQENKYPPQIKDVLAATLNSAQWRAIREPASAIFPPPPGKDTTPLPSMAELIEMKGDLANGRVIFNTTGTCNKCHKVNEIGQDVGPDLSEIGKKLSLPAMYESILYPSAGISHNYENWLVLTLEGQVYAGLLISESDTEVKLKDEKGIIRTIPVASIDAMKKQDISLMPGDLQKLMTVQELVDVVEYLQTLKVKQN